MNKKTMFLLAAVALLVPAIANAQTGCDNSPENPTAILGLMGVAAVAMPVLRQKIRNWRNR